MSLDPFHDPRSCAANLHCGVGKPAIAEAADWYETAHAKQPIAPLPVRVGRPESRQGVSLIEMLCVITIICILAGLMLPAIARAYHRVRGMTDEWEADAVADMLRRDVRGYCGAHPQYNFLSKSDFEGKCRLDPKCRAWMEAPTTLFVPFQYLDASNLTVVTVYLGPKLRTVYSFEKVDLTASPSQ